MRVCVLLLLVACAVARGAVITITGDTSATSPAVDGVSGCNDASSQTDGTYFACAGAVKWNGIPAASDYDSLPTKLKNWASTYPAAGVANSSLNEYSLLSEEGGKLFRISFDSYRPYVWYGSAEFICDQSLPISTGEAFSCHSFVQNGTGSFSVQFEEKKLHATPESAETDDYVKVTISAGASASATNHLLAIAFSRAYLADQDKLETAAIAAHVRERRESSRVAVGFLWGWICLTVFWVVALSSVWHTWWIPLPKPVRPYALAIWTLTMTLLTVLLCIFTGLGGFVGITVIMGCYCCIINMVYCCIRVRRKAAMHKGVSVDAENKNGDAKAPVRAMNLETGEPRAPPKAESYRRYPDELAERQRKLMGMSSLLILVCFVVCVAIFGLWEVKDYVVWQRSTQTAVIEIIPQTLAKGLSAVYVFDGYASNLKMDNVFFSVTTQWCGQHYTQTLADNTAKEASIKRAFIDKYKIDMTQFTPEDYRNYSNVNEWFTRHLRPGARPIAAPLDNDIIVSPADCRVMVFPDITTDTNFWLKNENFSPVTLLGPQYGSDFNGGSMVLLRLAAQDYHRFHVPTSGTILSSEAIEGTLHSVNADGMTSHNYAIYNQRYVIVYDSPAVGRVAFVAVGATCVASVIVHQEPGSSITKGDELGYFQFGGSTIALLFQKDKVKFDDDLLSHSKQRVETLLNMGQRVAVRV